MGEGERGGDLLLMMMMRRSDGMVGGLLFWPVSPRCMQ